MSPCSDYAMPAAAAPSWERSQTAVSGPVLVLSILPEEVHAGEVFKAGGAGTSTREAPMKT